ncbi:MAG: NB-ARC domain-containing protein [Cyanobacteria bacterium P01_F01_bin.150]
MTHALILLEASLGLQFTPTQALVLQHVWQGRTYTQIAEKEGYSTDYVKSVGSQLWKTLSRCLKQPVNKSNVRVILSRNINQCATSSQSNLVSELLPLARATSGPTIDSRLYEWYDAPPQFWGRTEELALLQDWLTSRRYRVISLLGLGGMGKTALVMQCAMSLQQGIKQEFDALLWRSLSYAPSVDDLLSDLLQSITGQTLDKLPPSSSAKLSTLLSHLRQHRYLIVLDEWDTIIHRSSSNQHANKCTHGHLLNALLEEPHQSCILLTSREKPVELLAQEGDGQPGRSLTLRSWDRTAVQELFKASDVHLSGPMADRLLHQYSGNVLALKSVASAVRDVFHHDATAIFTQDPLIFGAIETILDQHIRQLSTTELDMLHVLANHPQGCTIDQLRNHLASTTPRHQVLETILALQSKAMLEPINHRFTIPCLVAEYLKRIEPSILSTSVSA